MTNNEMTIDELIELGDNPQKMQEYIESKRNKSLNRCVKERFLKITESLRSQYNERLDGRYVYMRTSLRIHLDNSFINWLNGVSGSNDTNLDKLIKERLSPSDVARIEKTEKIAKKLRKEIDEVYPFEENFIGAIKDFFRGFCIGCIRNGEYEEWNDIFDVVYEEVFQDSLLVRIKREYRHGYELILNTFDTIAQNHTWFS